jgi:hypothetical protein
VSGRWFACSTRAFCVYLTIIDRFIVNVAIREDCSCCLRERLKSPWSCLCSTHPHGVQIESSLFVKKLFGPCSSANERTCDVLSGGLP